MSEQTESNPQQMIVIGLVVVAVLLAAIVGILIYNQSQAIPAPTATGPAQAAPTDTQAAPAGMGGGASAPAAATEFDAKTATKVPEGMTPEQTVKTYLDAVVAGKYEDAYKLLPIDTQKNYGDSKAYAEQVKSYGITSGEIGEPVTEGDTVTIVATQITPQMPIAYTWTFKKVGDQWYAAARAMGGK